MNGSLWRYKVPAFDTSVPMKLACYTVYHKLTGLCGLSVSNLSPNFSLCLPSNGLLFLLSILSLTLPCQWNLNFYSHHHLFFTADFSTCPARLIINEVLLNVFDWQIWHVLPCMLSCTATCTKYMTRWFSTAQILLATHMYIYYNDCEYSYIVLSRLTLSKQIGIFIKTVGFSGGFSVYKWATFWAVKLHLYKWGRLLCFCNIFFALFHLCKGAFL